MPDQGEIAAERGLDLRVGLVVGGASRPGLDGQHCGVRDYAACLADALGGVGVEARLLAPARWRLTEGMRFYRSLRRARLDIVHLHYPSIGHRRSLLPHGLGLCGSGARFVVTLHEHSALPRAQRAANRLFGLGADRLVFTTDFEAAAFGPGKAATVIPIGSNVPVHRHAPPRDNRVAYFGQVRPDKGIENYLALAALAAARGDSAEFVVIGTAPLRWRGYANELRRLAAANVRWIDQASADCVARELATVCAAYLPFPDGAGLRRGSLLAALSNGLPVIAPFGPATTEVLRAVLWQADTPAVAYDQLCALRTDSLRARERATAGRTLMGCFGWDAIAARHVALYHDVLERQRKFGPALKRLFNERGVGG